MATVVLKAEDQEDVSQENVVESDGCGFSNIFKKHKKSDSDEDQPLIENQSTAIIPQREYLSDYKHVYKMNHGKRGKMIIISNRYFLESSGLGDYPRHGTEFDAENLQTTFCGLDFECEIHEDKTCGQMLQLVINASNSPEVDCDCMAFAFLSHGSDNGLICGIDEAMPIDTLLSPLKYGHNMQKFAGKPKLVFIQACRGERCDPGVDVVDGPDPTLAYHRIPTEADFLYSYSTSPGYYSFRGQRGSVYIRTLCEMIRRYQHSHDLATILTRVSSEIASMFKSNVNRQHPAYAALSGKKQMPSTVSMLTKDLFFMQKRRDTPVRFRVAQDSAGSL